MNVKLDELRVEARELTEDEAQHAQGGIIVIGSKTTDPDPSLIGLLLPAVQKVR
jgi:hypothetical protein